MRNTTGWRGQLLLAAASLLVASSPALAGDPAAGRTVWEKQCKTCHSIAGEGGKKAETGGSLDGVGAKRDEAWIRAYLKDPKSKIPDSKMVKLPLSDRQFEDVVAYLLTLQTPAPAK